MHCTRISAFFPRKLSFQTSLLQDKAWKTWILVKFKSLRNQKEIQKNWTVSFSLFISFFFFFVFNTSLLLILSHNCSDTWVMISECLWLEVQLPKMGKFVSEKPNSSEQRQNEWNSTPELCKTSVHGEFSLHALNTNVKLCLLIASLQAAFPFSLIES